MTTRARVLGLLLSVASCGGGGGPTTPPADAAPPPTDECGSVRLTSYTAATGGWCEYDRTSAVLPAFVREGLTTAIAEPWNGGSYGGEPGESCGECWEVDTIADTRTVMVHDLCPIQGNPLCAGGHFHFDLAGEAGTALQAGGLDEASARRVPCPVAGNVFVHVIDRNEWGYLRLQFINHRIPIRRAEYRAAGGTEWKDVTRSGGAWHVVDDGVPFAAGGPGGVFRLTSAQGETVEAPNVLGWEVVVGADFDLGAQLTDQQPSGGGACVFVPPADVYVDGWGGIPEVRWMLNPWGESSGGETTDGCRAGSCVRVSSLAQWSGFHIYHRQSFPSATFATLTLWLRDVGGSGSVNVFPAGQSGPCTETLVPVGDAWSSVTIDVAAVCVGVAEIDTITVNNPGPGMTLLLDDVRFAQ